MRFTQITRRQFSRRHGGTMFRRVCHTFGWRYLFVPIDPLTPYWAEMREWGLGAFDGAMPRYQDRDRVHRWAVISPHGVDHILLRNPRDAFLFKLRWC